MSRRRSTRYTVVQRQAASESSMPPCSKGGGWQGVVSRQAGRQAEKPISPHRPPVAVTGHTLKSYRHHIAASSTIITAHSITITAAHLPGAQSS
jgi:hypothetical protein